MLLVLSVVCVFLVLLRVMLMRDNRNRDLSPIVTSTPTFRLPKATPPPNEAPAPAIIETRAEAPELAEAGPAPGEPQPQTADVFAVELFPHEFESGDVAEEARFQALLRRVPGATDVGVVDLRRLVAAQRPDSRAAVESLIRRIKRAVAVRAAAHGFALVFDRSAESLSSAPVLLDTEGLPDITDEVLQDLSE